MHITAWHIDGFGVLHDRRVDSLGPGLTVFIGRNEAGKSTLLGFVRAMLFGFPSRRSAEIQYPPVAGGRAGGTLVLHVPPHDGLPGGELTITRYGEKRKGLSITLPGGVAGTEEQLQEFLGHADRNLFQSIFAFSLTELQSLASLEGQGVRDRIFSAGIAGAGRSASGVIKQLDEDLDALYLAGGRKNRVRMLVNDLESLWQELEEARGQMHRYGELCAQEAQYLEAKEVAARREDELRNEAARWGLLQELWPVHVQARQLEAQLAELPAVDEFVPQGLTLLTERLARVEAASQQAQQQAAAVAALRQEQAKLAGKLDDTLQAVAAAVDAHAADLNLHRDRLQHRTAADGAVTQAQENLALTLHDLGPDWDEQHVAACDTSLPRQEEAAAWRERLTQAAERQGDAQHRHAELQRQCKEAAQEADLLARQGESQAGQAVAAQAGQESPTGAAGGAGAKGNRVTVGLGALAAALLAAAVWQLAVGNRGVFAALLLAAAAVAAGAVMASGSRGQGKGVLAEARRREMELAARVAQLQGHVASQIAQAREKAARCEAQLAQAAADLENARRAAADLGDGWLRYKQALRLGESLSPEGVMVFLSKVESARKEVLGVERARQRAAELRVQIAAWQERAAGLLRQTQRAVPEGEGAVIDAFVRLAQDVADDRRRRGEYADAARRLAACESQAAQAGTQARGAQDQLAELLAQAGVAGEAQFRQKHEWYTRRQEIRRELAAACGQLAGRVGQGEQAAALIEELAGGQTALWQQRQAAALAELPQVQAARESAVRRHQDALKERTAMEESTDVPALEVRIESLRCELAQAVDQWKVKALAKALVETTLGEFVHARQPAVLEQASKDYAFVTESAYTRIEQDAESASLAVVDKNHVRKGPEQLSRGTAEQLYLCLRLGLAREFARQRVALPVVMDDVLVNFDPHRAALMAAVLADFAKDHQVLLLTCHPSTVEILRAACPDLRVEQM